MQESASSPLNLVMPDKTGKTLGWGVKVHFSQLLHRIRPKDHMEALRPLLPFKYSPLQANGNGLQSVYLTEIPEQLAEMLLKLIGPEIMLLQQEAEHVLPVTTSDVDSWEQYREQNIATYNTIPETERTALVQARRGQGLFKERVSRIETRCRITGVNNPAHLIASHCKPWRHSTNEERLDGENGLLLTPSIDHLFDRGFIGFEDNGTLIVSPVAHRISLQRMGIRTEQPVNVGVFTSGQKEYLDFHRNSVLLKSVR